MAKVEQAAWQANEGRAFNNLDSSIQTADPEGIDDSGDELTDLAMEQMDLGDEKAESTEAEEEDVDEMTEEELHEYQMQYELGVPVVERNVPTVHALRVRYPASDISMRLKIKDDHGNIKDHLTHIKMLATIFHLLRQNAGSKIHGD
ncbi:hypothetical protein N0V90_007533 [Kalmusia sp. IMI 367209]|nr:hypothetical protein N0V90_007533 [Kalmusia sp. IMI 367209]